MKHNLFFLILFLSISLGSVQHCASKYYSQVGQDEFMHKNFFPNKTDGIIIDIGANDGVRFSNSLFFEQVGWRCVCIEPLPRAFNELIKNRACVCIQACVSENEGIAEFLEISGACEMLSGLTSKYDPRHINRIAFEVQQNRDSYGIINVPCITLNSILEKNGINHIDILSLDTEGGELEILMSIDFARYTFDVICVEDNYHDPKIRIFLEQKGFVLVQRLEHDLIFRNIKFLSQ